MMERELPKLAQRITPYIEAGKSHSEACDALLMELYEESLSEEGKDDGSTPTSVPKNWVHAHNNLFTAFRLYYDGDKPDETFPEPTPPVPIVVPSEKPQLSKASSHYVMQGSSSPMPHMPMTPLPNTNAAASLGRVQLPHNTVEDRQRILNEVRDHLELLKEFEGIIPDEEINRRKRQLFEALPPAPPKHPRI